MKSQNNQSLEKPQPQVPEASLQHQLLKSLENGKVTTVPTETVEGYAVKLDNISAIQTLMCLKERDFNSGKIFTLVPKSPADISNYALIPDSAKPIIKKHIPGELTIILPKNPSFKHYYYNHFDTIGIRIPDYKPFQELLTKTGPLILTSANPKGGTPKSITGHKPSTIVDFTGDTPVVIRQGNLKIDLDHYTQ